MSIEQMTKAREAAMNTSAFKNLLKFFDENSFSEIDGFAKSGKNYAEVVAGFGMVEGMPVYAFAQNRDVCGGAMSKAHAAKVKKIYDLALKTGAPVVGFYDSIGGKLREGNELLAGYGDVLKASGQLSGVVPQISVILGNCLGTGALTAANADFIIMNKKATLSLSTMGTEGTAEDNAKKGISALTAENNAEAIAKARELITYLPSNNLSSSAAAFEAAPAAAPKCPAEMVADENTLFELYANYGSQAVVSLGRVDGRVVGFVGTKGESVGYHAGDKIAKFVRFCDAFSIPVITFVNSEEFTSIKTASKVTSAYAEATTVKISVVTGTAVGALYIAMAGSGANADVTFALSQAIISPVTPEAAAFIMAPDKMNVVPAKQKEAAMKFAQAELSAFKAAENGFVEDVITEDELRGKIAAALEMLEGKRVPTLAKKHSTI